MNQGGTADYVDSSLAEKKISLPGFFCGSSTQRKEFSCTSQQPWSKASRIFSGLDAVEQVGRYHSLAAEEATMPDCLKIAARTEDDEIMAVEHTRYPIFGIQFHPESILTPHGSRILENFVNLSKRRTGR